LVQISLVLGTRGTFGRRGTEGAVQAISQTFHDL
jgi:hypothetical protein